jgi:hypothetical protein
MWSTSSQISTGCFVSMSKNSDPQDHQLHYLIALSTISWSKHRYHHLKEHIWIVYSTLETRPRDISFLGGSIVFIPSSETLTHKITNFTTSELYLQSAKPNEDTTIWKSMLNLWFSLLKGDQPTLSSMRLMFCFYVQKLHPIRSPSDTILSWQLGCRNIFSCVYKGAVLL